MLKNNIIEIFGILMNALTMSETVEIIKDRLNQNRFTQHGVVNVAKLVKMKSDQQLKDAVAACDIINIDGMGVIWGARFLSYRIPERVAGIDLFFELLKLAEIHDYSVFFLGAEDSVVDNAVSKLKKKYPKLAVAGWHHGYFWENELAVIDEIRNSGATMLFVAISSPQKEQFINRWKEKLGVKFVMGVGGTFDIVAEKTRRAPIWMQRCGLEWFFRLLQEPGRMWKRYLKTNFQFFWMLVSAKFSIKSRYS